MIRFEEALARILEKVQPLPSTAVSLADILGRVTAEPVQARLDSPYFDNSAVDGYGVRLTDIACASPDAPVKLRIKQVIRAGNFSTQRLEPKNAFKILTGAAVPAGVDAVVMKEYCDEKDGHVLVKHGARAGENIRRRGEEFLRGQEILPAGHVVTPPVVGLLASLGYSKFPARRKIRAAVVTTGDELTKLGRDLLPGKIYDSNSYAMASALQSMGIDDIHKLHAPEDLNGTKKIFQRALAVADVIISTGGVSVGDYDFVKDALEALKVDTHVWKIAMKPGKPVYFGIYSERANGPRKYIFGLPGNPVSALVTFNQLVAPALKKLQAITECQTPTMMAKLTKTIKKKAGRMEFVRGVLTNRDTELLVEPTVGQESHMLSGMANASALIVFPLEAETLESGQMVAVQLLNWRL